MNVDIEPFISVQRLSKGYEEGGKVRQVLSGLNFEIVEGELVVLFGRSGSGKSTLLNLLGGIDQPDAGSIFIQGKDLAQLNEHERTIFRRLHIGFVFQSFNLIPTLTVEENCLLPLQLKGIDSKKASAQALGYLDQVGLSDRANSFPDSLSGGEQQRVAIARALAHEPLLLLADEPTGNLDYTTAEEIRAILKELSDNHGRTIVIATHDKDMCSIADKIYQLQSGVLIPEAEPNSTVHDERSSQ